MTLDGNINYIISGLERSGTSMLMQLIVNGGAPSSFDNETRPPDTNNPKGYYELEGGKIINKLMNGSFSITEYLGRFIKITAFGIKFLPHGNYKIIYSERNIEEILDSMEKMTKIEDNNRDETRLVFTKLNNMIKNLLVERKDCDVLFVNYNDIMSDPKNHIRAIHEFIGSPDMNLDKMIATVDTGLHRNKKA
ncbi:MAG: sulfotransferase domain-containing protein [Acidobacteria bacterium]|nr:sulfotransferase domain-containing protein [Acidobacteriota bacterium]